MPSKPGMGPSAPALASTALLPPKAGGGAVWEERTEQEGPGHGEAMRSLQRPAQRHSASLNTLQDWGKVQARNPTFWSSARSQVRAGCCAGSFPRSSDRPESRGEICHVTDKSYAFPQNPR